MRTAPGEREKFLEDACHGDDGLRDEVASLLQADQQAYRFLTASNLDAHLRELNSEAPAKELGPIPEVTIESCRGSEPEEWVKSIVLAIPAGS